MNAMEKKSFRNAQWQMLFAVMFCYLFFYTGRQNFGWAIPGIMDEFKISKQQIGWAGAGMLWAYGLGQFINGNLGDKYGARFMMTLGALLSVAMNWATSYATSFTMIVIFWTINGYCQSLGWAPGSRLISNWWGQKERGKAFGFYVFSAACSTILIYLLSIVLLKEYEMDWRWLFRLPVLLLIVGSTIFFFVVRNSPKDRGFEESIQKEEQSNSVKRYKTAFKNKKFMLACVSIGLQNAARYGLLVWIPLYFLGYKLNGSGNVWITIALPVGMAVGTVVCGQLSDKYFDSNRSKPIFLAMLLAAATIFSMYFITDNKVMSLIVLFMAGFFVYGPQSCFWPLSPDLLGRENSGTGVGVMNTFAYAFAGAGEPLIGYVIDTTGDGRSVFMVTGILCILSAVNHSFC